MENEQLTYEEHRKLSLLRVKHLREEIENYGYTVDIKDPIGSFTYSVYFGKEHNGVLVASPVGLTGLLDTLYTIAQVTRVIKES